MIITEKQQIEENAITDIVCDCCGRSCRDEHGMNYEYAIFCASWGYYSQHDTEIWECHLCEACSEKVKAFIDHLGGTVRISCYM